MVNTGFDMARLPTEILDRIAEFAYSPSVSGWNGYEVPDYNTLHNATRVSAKFRKSFEPILYQTIDFDKCSLEAIKQMLITVLRDQPRGRYIKNLIATYPEPGATTRTETVMALALPRIQRNYGSEFAMAMFSLFTADMWTKDHVLGMLLLFTPRLQTLAHHSNRLPHALNGILRYKTTSFLNDFLRAHAEPVPDLSRLELVQDSSNLDCKCSPRPFRVEDYLAALPELDTLILDNYHLVDPGLVVAEASHFPLTATQVPDNLPITTNLDSVNLTACAVNARMFRLLLQSSPSLRQLQLYNHSFAVALPSRTWTMTVPEMASILRDHEGSGIRHLLVDRHRHCHDGFTGIDTLGDALCSSLPDLEYLRVDLDVLTLSGYTETPDPLVALVPASVRELDLATPWCVDCEHLHYNNQDSFQYVHTVMMHIRELMYLAANGIGFVHLEKIVVRGRLTDEWEPLLLRKFPGWTARQVQHWIAEHGREETLIRLDRDVAGVAVEEDV